MALADGVDPRFSLASAQQAASAGRSAEWVGAFLASTGSDNAPLAAALAQRRHRWFGPVRVRTDDLVRLAGPEPDAPASVDEPAWEHDVGGMAGLGGGWEPPPLLAEWRHGELLLQDDNHRYEAVVRSGATHVWVLVYADDPFAVLDDRLQAR